MAESALNDTTPEAERFQVALMRKMKPAERVARMRALSSLVIGFSRQAIAKSFGFSVKEDIDLKFVELHYGSMLADGMRRRRRM